MKITIEGERGCGCTTVATLIGVLLERLGASVAFAESITDQCSVERSAITEKPDLSRLAVTIVDANAIVCEATR